MTTFIVIAALVALVALVLLVAWALCRAAAIQETDEGEAFGGDYR
jgi:hypothetical protein